VVNGTDWLPDRSESALFNQSNARHFTAVGRELTKEILNQILIKGQD